MSRRDPDLRDMRPLAMLVGVGFTMGAAVAIGAGLGVWADRKFGLKWATIAGTLLGVAAAFRELFAAVNRASREQERIDRERADAARTLRERASGGAGDKERDSGADHS